MPTRLELRTQVSDRSVIPADDSRNAQNLDQIRYNSINLHGSNNGLKRKVSLDEAIENCDWFGKSVVVEGQKSDT